MRACLGSTVQLSGPNVARLVSCNLQDPAKKGEAQIQLIDFIVVDSEFASRNQKD